MHDAVLLDGSNGVAREVKRQLEVNELLKEKSVLGTVMVYNSLDGNLISLY